MDDEFHEGLEAAKRDVFTLEREASALQATVRTIADTEAELISFKNQWSIDENTLRLLASKNAIEFRSNIKQFRIQLNDYIMQEKRAARKRSDIPSCTSEGLSLEDVLKAVRCRRMAFSRWLSGASRHQYQKAVIVHIEIFRLLEEIKMLFQDALKVLRIKQEITGLKTAINVAESYMESNRSLVEYCVSKVKPPLEKMTSHVPQECLEMRNRDVPSTPNDLDMSFDCDIAALVAEFKVPTPVSNIDDSFSDSSDVIENISSCELDCSVMSEDIRTEVQKAADINSCNEDSTQFTSDAEGTLPPCDALEDGPSIVCPRTEETYELRSVFPISSLNDRCSEMSDVIEIIPRFELDYSIMLEDVRSEIQMATGVNNDNTDSAQFLSDTTGTLTPFASCIDGPSSMFLNTKENEEINYSWHNEGQNLPEEHVDEDDAEGVIVHHSLQETSPHFMVPLIWSSQSF